MPIRVLLDEDIPIRFRHHLQGYDVRTVRFMGWQGKVNGELLALVRDEFDVLITLDQRMPHQQNLTDADVGVIILISKMGRIEDLIPLIPQLLAALPGIRRGQILAIRADNE